MAKKTVMSELVVRMTAETAELKAEMQRVRKTVDQTAKQLSSDFAKAQKGIDSFAGALGLLRGGLGALGIVLTAQQVLQFGVNSIKAADQLNSFKKGLTAVSSSSNEAAQSIAFVDRLAYQMGLNIQNTRQAFLDLSAATQGTAMAGEKTRKIFESVTRYGNLMGKSAAQIGLGFYGLSQMASLGVVSMEEVKQVQENLGVSQGKFAEALGVPVESFKKLIATGTVLANDLLPKLGEVLDKLTGSSSVNKIETFDAAWNRLTDQITRFQEVLGQTSAMRSIVSFIDDMAGALKTYNDEVARTGSGMLIGPSTSAADLENTRRNLESTRAEILRLQQGGASALGVFAQFAETFFPDSMQQVWVDRLVELSNSVDRLKASIERLTPVVNSGLNAAILTVSTSMRQADRDVKVFSSGLDELTRNADVTAGKMINEMGIGGGASATVAERVFNIKSDFLRQYDDYIAGVAQRYGLEKNWMLAVLRQETTLGTNIRRSSKGAIGPMQIMPATGRDLGYSETQLEDPRINIEASGKLLQQLYKGTKGNLFKTFRKYAGRGEEARIYARALMGHVALLNSASGAQTTLKNAVTATTGRIKEQEDAVNQLKIAQSKMTEQRDMDQIGQEIKARELQINALKKLEQAENSLVIARERATKEFYNNPANNLDDNARQQQLLQMYVSQNTQQEMAALKEAQEGLSSAQQEIAANNEIFTNQQMVAETKRRQAVEESFNGIKTSIEQEIELYRTVGQAKEDLIIKYQIQSDLQKMEGLSAEELAAKQRELAQAYRDRAAAQREAVAREMQQGLEDERAQLLMTSEAYIDYQYARQVANGEITRQSAERLSAMERENARLGELSDFLSGVESSFSSAFDAMLDGTTTFADAMRNLFKSMVAAIIKEVFRLLILKPLMESLMTLGAGWMGIGMGTATAGGGFTSPAYTGGFAGPLTYTPMHSGGMVGRDAAATGRPLSPMSYIPKFHSGLLPSEYPAILQRGEGVFTPGQLAALGNRGSVVNVVVNNNAQATVETRQKTRSDGGVDLELIIQSLEGRMVKNVQSGGTLARTFENKYGLNPGLGARRIYST